MSTFCSHQLLCLSKFLSSTRELSMEGAGDVGEPAINSEMANLGLDGSKEAGDGPSSETGTTPEVLFYVVPYCGLKELLTLERVSSQLREAVRGDARLWQQLHVDAPLNKKITNTELMRLSSRSHGRLQSLSLVNCTKIAEGVIEEILQSNPRLHKLNLSGCTQVSVEDVLRMAKMQTERRSVHVPGLTQLRIRGIYGTTLEILTTLLTMMQLEGNQTSRSPQYYKNGDPSPAISEERPIDLEACPKCRNPGLVFDCTRPACQQRRHTRLQQCRGCHFCIPRCEECGMCIQGDDYEETFCMELVCQPCWLNAGLPKCPECNRAGCRRHAELLHISETSISPCDSCQELRLAGPSLEPISFRV